MSLLNFRPRMQQFINGRPEVARAFIDAVHENFEQDPVNSAIVLWAAARELDQIEAVEAAEEEDRKRERPFRYRFSEGDGYYTHIYLLPARPTGWTREQIVAHLEEYGQNTESDYCQHSHDCCGHWYCSGLDFFPRPSGRVLVTVSYYQNV